MAEQKNTLVIEIDAKNAENNVKKLTEELRKITEAGNKAAADNQKLGTTINQTNKITQVFNTTVNNSTKNITNNTKTVNNNSTAVERNSQAVDRNSRAVASQSDAFQKLAGYMAGILTVGTAISKMDTYTNLQNRLKLVTANQEELNKSLKDTFAIAQETAQAWETVTMVYQRFSDNAKKLNLTMDDTASLTNTVAKAIAISGSSATSAEAALMQFGQALASGVLRGEEFNSIAEQAPALLKAIATGLDVDIGKLRAMAGEGKLTGEVVIGALKDAKVSVDELFAKTDFSIAMGFTQLNNAVIEFVGEAGHANGAAISLSAALKTLSENLGLIANVALLGGIAYLTKAIASQTVVTYKSVSASIARRTATTAEAQANATASASELSRATAIMNLTKWQLDDAKAQMLRLSGMQRLAYFQNVVMAAEAKHTAAIAAHKAALDADTLAQNANNAARSRGAMVMGALGGVTGLLTIGVTALAAGYMYLKSKADEVNDSYSTQITKVGELAQKYRELNTAKLVQEQELVNQKLKDFKSDAIDAENAITRLAGSSQRAVGKQKEQQDMLATIAKDLRNGATTTGEALEKMVNSGLFTDKHIAKAQKYFEEFRVSKSGVREMERQLEFIADQTGLFGNATDEASKKLNNQKIILNAMSDSYESLNDEFKNSVNWLLQQDSALKTNEKSIAIVNKAVEDYSKGTLTASQLAEVLRKNLPIESATLDSITSLAKETTGAKDELEKARKEAEKLPAAGEKGKQGFKLLEGGANDATGAVAGLNAELEKVNKTQDQRLFDAVYLNKLASKGITGQRAKDFLDTQNALGRNKAITKEQADAINNLNKEEDKYQKTLDAITEKERERTKAIKEQNKEREKGTKLSALVLANAKKYNFAEKEQRYNLPPNIIAAIQQQESGGNTYNKKGGLLTSPKGAQGSSQFMPKTAKRFNVDVRSVDSSAEGTAKYLRYLLDEFKGDLDKAIMSYNAGEGNVASGKAYSFKETQNYLKKVKGYMGASEYTSQWESAEKDKQKLQEEYAQRQADIDYKYATSKVQRETELQRELLYLRQNGREKEADLAQRFFDENEKLINMQNVYSLSEHKLTEEQKLGFNRRINEQIIVSNREMGLQEKKDKINALNEIFEYEKSKLEATAQLRESEYEQLYMSESQLIIQRYADEVREAMKVRDIDEQNHLVRMANARRELAIQEQINNARNGWRGIDPSENNPYSSVEGTELTQRQASESLLNAEVFRLEEQKKAQMELMKMSNEEEINASIDFNDRMARVQQEGADRIADIEARTARARLELNMATAGGIAGTFADMFKTIAGEQSAAYKVMFATEKAFNIAKTMMAIPVAIAEAAKAGPFPANLVAMSTVAALTGSLVSDIMAVGNVGFKSGGYTGNGGTSDVAGVVHGQEYVLNAQATRRVGVDTLNAINNGGSLGGGINVSIQNYGSSKQFEVQQISANDVRIIARDEARKAVSSDLANPNSQVSKAVSQNTTAVRSRG